jgi:hypothetical protein
MIFILSLCFRPVPEPGPHRLIFPAAGWGEGVVDFKPLGTRRYVPV